MKYLRPRTTIALGLVAITVGVTWRLTKLPIRKATGFEKPATITIDYPLPGSIFPPEFPAPTWLWRTNGDDDSWQIQVSFADGSPALEIPTAGEPMRIGESDPRCVAATNQPPGLSVEQAAAHSFTPDDATWALIKQHSVEHPATVTIIGRRSQQAGAVARGQTWIRTSREPVGAPIFYRDVPLMPSENEKGVIKPLAPQAVPLIAWRLRNVAHKQSQVVLEGIHTCANCHSFSSDGKTLGMDMDGPQNDKGLYALAAVQAQMSIRNEDLIAWSTFRGKLGSKLRVGFMSQISPDSQYVVTTVNDPGVDQTDFQRRKDPVDLVKNYYVANFKDYRFLQVFYPTRGLLAWYSRSTAHLNYLPGADDPEYVHVNPVWSPDGKFLVFARAKARDAYPAGAALAQHANDPNETQIQYDLYRIAFNGGQGGAAEPILGASRNGMSNSFPKVSPDGRWIVFVQAHNGLLMRPDGQLYIIPAAGGVARRMNCNTPLMNSWHSFSPNGHWLVFSSKSRSPYTQMFLTHIDADGNDSPAILIENATAANRAVNIPEFINRDPDAPMKIDAPAAEYARHLDQAVALMKQKQYQAAVEEWRQALVLAPTEPRNHNSLGVALMELGDVDAAIAQYQEALVHNPQYSEAYNNLGEALARKGDVQGALTEFTKAVQFDPNYAVGHSNLGMLLARTGQSQQALEHLRKVVELMPDASEALRNLGHALADSGQFQEASVHLQRAVALARGQDPLSLHLLGRVYADLGERAQSILTERQALTLAQQQGNERLAAAVLAHLQEMQRIQPE